MKKLYKKRCAVLGLANLAAAIALPFTINHYNSEMQEIKKQKIEWQQKQEQQKQERESVSKGLQEDLKKEWSDYRNESEKSYGEKLPENSRGVTNNNPGNIKYNGTNWQGLVGRDGAFCKFESPEYGLRAIGRNLRTYEKKYGLDTIEEIVTRWAPKEDGNDTNSYIKYVADQLNCSPKDKLNLYDKKTMTKLMSAISKRDSGADYSEKRLEAAYSLLE